LNNSRFTSAGELAERVTEQVRIDNRELSVIRRVERLEAKLKPGRFTPELRLLAQNQIEVVDVVAGADWLRPEVPRRKSRARMNEGSLGSPNAWKASALKACRSFFRGSVS
jgi:hypothetical protein